MAATQWTEELKAEVVSRYTEVMERDYDNDADRAENATSVIDEIVTQLKDSGENPGATVNGVRYHLVKAGVYHAKVASKSSGAKSGGGSRVSKAEAHQELTNLINTIDPEAVDSAIIEKLTGKAAQYFSSVLTKVL